MPAEACRARPRVSPTARSRSRQRRSSSRSRTRDMIADTKVRSTLITQGLGPRPGDQGAVDAQAERAGQRDREPAAVPGQPPRERSTPATPAVAGCRQGWRHDQGRHTDARRQDGKPRGRRQCGHQTSCSRKPTRPPAPRSARARSGKRTTFVFDDKRRLGTYTEQAHLDGAQGDLTAHKIEIFLKPGANEVERLEAYAQGTDF